MKKQALNTDAITAISLSFVGGLLDVYCLFNFNVYATLHTGNMIKLMTNLLDGNISMFLETLFVLIAFAVGIFLTNIYESTRKNRDKRELFLISAALLLLSALAPSDGAPGTLSPWKLVAAALIGLEGAFLIHSFMRFGKYSYSATTMTANINRLMTVLHKRIREKDKTQDYAVVVYFLIFISFLFGVACGYGYLSKVPVPESGWLHLYAYNLILILPILSMLGLWGITKGEHR